jgi:hypothetical protein
MIGLPRGYGLRAARESAYVQAPLVGRAATEAGVMRRKLFLQAFLVHQFILFLGGIFRSSEP